MEHYPKGYMGIDKKGRPIYIERTGLIKVDKVWEVTTAEELWPSFY